MGCYRLCCDASVIKRFFWPLRVWGMRWNWTAKLVRDVRIIEDWLFMATYARGIAAICEVERALDTAVPFVVDRQQKNCNITLYTICFASLRGALANDTKGIINASPIMIWIYMRFGVLMMLSYLSLPKIS